VFLKIIANPCVSENGLASYQEGWEGEKMRQVENERAKIDVCN